MGRIPYTSEVSALTGRSNSPLQTARTNPDAYGALQGEALMESGRAIQNAGSQVFEYDQREQARKKKQDEAVGVAGFDYTKRFYDLQNQVGSDAVEFQDRIRSDYMDYVDKYVDQFNDDEVRTNVRTSLLNDLPNLSSRAATWAVQTQRDNAQNRSNDAINGLQNKISLDPTQYDKYRQEGDAIIDALPNTTAAFREGMKLTWKNNSAKGRFDGMINNVKTIEDIDNISTELAGGEGLRDWQTEMQPADYESLMNTLGSMRKTFNDRNNTDARAVLSSLEERTNTEPTLLPSSELQQAQEIVKRTTDPSIQSRMGRIMRNQEIIRQEQRLPPAELRARINAANGNPGMAYPSLPIEVSDSINEVSEKTGVSASFLGAVAHREYGGEFAKAKRKGADELKAFKPTSIHSAVDTRNIRSDVLDATTMAGKAFGAPLLITQAEKGVNTAKSAINIVTLGMSPEEKAKAVGALADAGFTGFSEYNGYIQADMLHAVPESFGERDGKVWGGWTFLSPEVANTLKEKGFKGGADSSALKLNKIGIDQPKVNYGAPTSIVDEKGNPTSSAVGLFQFTNKTWLDTVKNENVAAMMGVDLTKMTDQQLLDLRADPRMSTIAAAALAKDNQRIMENTLGRPVSDAELYMAHFMGTPALTTFLNAYKNNPDQSAAELLPQTANANKPVFYDKGKALTVSEVYNDIARDFMLAPSKVAYEDNEVRKAMLKKAEQTLSTYPIQQAINSGSHVISGLQEDGGFTKRGAQSRAVADYYNIPQKDMKPFTQDEEAFIKKTISEGTVDDNLALMANIQSMGTEPAKGALKQLDQKDSVFAHAADLYLGGNPVVAGDIIRGRKRAQENPNLAKLMGVEEGSNDAADEFASAVGAATFEISPSRNQTLQEAATALYLERMSTSKGGKTGFDKQVYDDAVQEVLGGTPESPAIADVNGSPALLPRGLSATDVEGAFNRMTLEDWTAMSESGTPPKYADGGIVNPNDIRDEVMLRSIGGGQYKVMLDDGTYLTTGERNADGRLKAFIFIPDADKMRKAQQRPYTTAERTDRMTPIRGTEQLIDRAANR